MKYTARHQPRDQNDRNTDYVDQICEVHESNLKSIEMNDGGMPLYV